ncbi:CocE/NonD family hydrolase [Sphingosinicella sp. CPCC 101087]|uniref:CocE/NonD family hydrolase n=1 Tax=Sphingosinicella sp. CPCC 101087 TaxID=2497754 RepID=UPI00101DA8ED|nr:CocE/NonD family hydrolase [Sphingosinicella sp. CPCC 101087]
MKDAAAYTLLILATTALAACSSLPAAPPVATAATPTGEGSVPRYDEVVRQSLYVPVRDGTRLAMNIYRPAERGRAVETPLPVIFAFTPYRARYREENGETVEAGLSERLGLKGMTDHGYVVAVADIRGKGASFGTRRGFQDRTEAQDGHDLVEWLAAQPWSDGNVGMVGCSYLGGTTIQTASTAPPHLRAVFTGATDFDKYTFVRRGGITAQFNTRPDEPLSWDLASLPVDADRDGTLLRQAVEQHSGNTPMADLWYSMPYRDSISPHTGTRFWEEVGPYTYADTLRNNGVQYYLWVTWKDEPAEQILTAAANLPARVMIGPGSHCEAPPGVDLGAEQRRFFDRHLKGIRNGIDEEPRYRWWTLDAPAGEEWTRSDRLPGDGVDRHILFLDDGPSGTVRSLNDGALVAQRPDDGADSYRVDYDVEGQDYFPFWPAVLDERGLTYTSPPLARDVVLTGSPVVHLRVSADQDDTNLFVFLEEVDGQGRAENISFGRLALSHRAMAEPPYDNRGLPWHSGRSADVEPAVPGTAYSVSFALTPNSKRFRAGSRIRVSVRGADPRQRNLREIRRDPPETVTVHHGAGASRVEIPFLEAPVFAASE